MFKRLLVIGASRGLGQAIARFASVHLNTLESLMLVSRKAAALEQTRQLMGVADPHRGTASFEQARVSIQVCDLASVDGQQRCADIISESNFDLIIYAAGGGPHGEFAAKEWKDHLWALNLGLIAPMRLASSWLKVRALESAHEPGRFVVVGSRIAESQPDALASSYAASKHGLVGFVSSIQSEISSCTNKVWLFSPGYMDSQMLPLTAKVRHDGSKLMSTETAAQALLRWVKTDGPWHRVLN